MMPFGLYGNGFPQLMLDEIELGKRVASWIDQENNDPLTHFVTYGIEREDHWLHRVDVN